MKPEVALATVNHKALSMATRKKSLQSAMEELGQWKFKERKGSRPFSFRASSLPYCPMALAISMVRETVPTSVDFAGDLYMSIGSTIHSVYQWWLGRFYGKNLYGLWRCSKCGRVTKPRFRPKGCKKCRKKNTYVYEELLLREGDFSGHCDGVWFDGEDWWLLDIKSTGWRSYKVLNGFEDIMKKRAYWLHQLGAYAHILEKQGFVPKKFKGVLILLCDRQDPVKKWKIIEVPAYRDKFEESLEIYTEVKQLVKEGRYEEIERNCDTYHKGRYCDFQTVCFSDKFEYWMDCWTGRE